MLQTTGNKTTTSLMKGIDQDIDDAILETWLKRVTSTTATAPGKYDTGLYLNIDTKDIPMFIKGGKVEGVKVTDAWIMFTVDGVTVRTNTIEDRNNFYEFYQSENPPSFSKKKGDEAKFGPPNVTFYIVRGLATV